MTTSKRILFLVMIFSLGIGLAGCHPVPKARFEIIDWSQDYWEFLQEYSSVKISYRVTNIGPVDFTFYTVWIEVGCTDGSTFQEQKTGFGTSPGKYVTTFTYVNTMGKEAESICITDYKLTRY